MGEVRFDKISCALYSTDASVYQIIPQGVVIPKSRQDVIHTVRLCREHGVSITARGGGTSQAGQAVGAGIQLDFSKSMNRLLKLNPDRRTVLVEPGIVLDELNAILKPYGLHLPLDLSTSNRATIGGLISNNSSGTRSVIYGKTLDYVEELTVLLADGSVVEMRPLGTEELAVKCRQDNAEGACYRVVQKLADDHADEIDRRFPNILRRVGGYNLDEFVEGSRPFNLARLLVGSEGTLGLVLEAKLRLVPLPAARTVCVIHFHELLDALAATPAILAHGPSAVELMDRFILDTTRGKTEFEPLRDFIQGDPGAILIVEFFGESSDELPARVDRLVADLNQQQLGDHVHRAVDSPAQQRIWTLRRAALGLSMSQRGDGKAISFVEDSAVRPEHLRDYIERFLEILAAHETRAGFYAHASVGLLHIRPVVNLKTSDGVEKFRRIAELVAELVLEFGGALSGEHGDGLVRAPFQKKMFGPVLYDAFCEIKRTFDPEGLFNPGKIVNSPPLTENLRFGVDYETRDVQTLFDFSDFGGMLRASEQCGGVGACRKTISGTMCPSYMATRDEAHSTRGRANVLRLAMSGQLGPDGLSDSALFDVLDLCLECKACKTECPTGVDMARMKAEFLYQLQGRHGVSHRTQLLANLATSAKWGSRLAPISNWVLQSGLLRWWNQRLLGLDSRRDLPQFIRRTFLDWWHRHERASGHAADSDVPSLSDADVAIFADTFTNHFEPQHAIAAVRIVEWFGLRPTVPARVCCGRPLISKGLLDEARRQAEQTVHALLPLAERQIPIVFCEPGCFSAVKDDHPNLVPRALQSAAACVAAAAVTFEEWAGDLLARHLPNNSVQLVDGPRDILFHSHCHQKALVGTGPTVRLLSAIPETRVTVLDSGCCGMAGSFGYEKKHYEVSQTIGERILFPALRNRNKNATVIAPGFSCRHQIRHFTGVEAVSTPELLESLFAIG